MPLILKHIIKVIHIRNIGGKWHSLGTWHQEIGFLFFGWEETLEWIKKLQKFLAHNLSYNYLLVGDA